MKGDLHTLKRICEYASKVMLAGTFVLGIASVVVLILGFGSLFSDDMGSLLHDFVGVSAPSDAGTWCAFLIVPVILLLGTVTVYTVHRLMVSIRDEHSPFNDTNTSRMILLSKFYLVGAAVIGLLSLVAGSGFAQSAFIFFGCILIAVVLYCFGLVVRYGAVLQDESDHTL